MCLELSTVEVKKVFASSTCDLRSGGGDCCFVFLYPWYVSYVSGIVRRRVAVLLCVMLFSSIRVCQLC